MRLQPTPRAYWRADDKDRPFFLYYPMVLPHAPWIPTPDSPNARTDKARFAGMVTYMDSLVGQVTDCARAVSRDLQTSRSGE